MRYYLVTAAYKPRAQSHYEQVRFRMVLPAKMHGHRIKSAYVVFDSLRSMLHYEVGAAKINLVTEVPHEKFMPDWAPHSWRARVESWYAALIDQEREQRYRATAGEGPLRDLNNFRQALIDTEAV